MDRTASEKVSCSSSSANTNFIGSKPNVTLRHVTRLTIIELSDQVVLLDAI
jgi:hypothetical protein